MGSPLLTERPAPPPPVLRPLRRLSGRATRWLVIPCALVVAALLGSLAWALAADADGRYPGAAAGDGREVVLAVGDAELFDRADGERPGRVEGLDATWAISGDLVVEDGALVADGAGAASLELPVGERVVQVVLQRPPEGWTVAFAAGDVARLQVRFGADQAEVVLADGDAEAVVATAALPERGWVEVLVTWRDAQVQVALGPTVVWRAVAPLAVATDRLVLDADGTTEAGVDLVGVRRL